MFKRTILLAVVAGLVFALAPSAQAALSGPGGIVCPTGAHPDGLGDWDVGDTYRLVFVTSTKTAGTSTDIGVYNTFVQTAAGLSTETGVSGLSWMAIGSTATVTAKSNTSTTFTEEDPGFPIYLLDGTTKVADDYKDLWDGGIDAKINKDENLVAVAANQNMITGTSTDGTGGTVLGDGSGNVTYGRAADKVNSDWVAKGTTPAANSNRMMALSPELVIVPEPATLALLGLGGLGLLFGRKRK